MNIPQQNDPRKQWIETATEQQAEILHAAKKLPVTHPFVFVFILFGVLVHPAKLKAYRIQLNPTERYHLKRQAARLTATLVWLPLLAVFTLIWLTERVRIGADIAALVLLFATVACLVTFRNKLSVSQEDINNVLLAGVIGVFGLTAVLAAALDKAEASGGSAIMLILISFLFVLMALCIAMVFKLHTLETLCGIIAILLGGCIAITMLNAMTHIWLPILVILCAVLLVGVTEERHDLNRSQQSIFHR